MTAPDYDLDVPGTEQLVDGKAYSKTIQECYSHTLQ